MFGPLRREYNGTAEVSACLSKIANDLKAKKPEPKKVVLTPKNLNHEPKR